tara:strand:+ start:1207 stop:1794 length:588 start_codon:yes stop_codon:yes gene_type:complete
VNTGANAAIDPNEQPHSDNLACDHILSSLNDIVMVHEAQKESILAAAQRLIDLYWEWFMLENHRIVSLHKQGQSKSGEVSLFPNPVAPVIEYRANKGSLLKKPYLIWKSHSRKFRTNMQAANKRAASLPLHSYASNDNTSVLKRKCTWNLTRAVALENQLIPFRDALNGIHESQKKLHATIRKIKRVNNKGESHE